VVDKMIAHHPDISSDDSVAVLGGNAARLFRRANLSSKVAERAEMLRAAQPRADPPA
jgi:hypothetical protein